MNQFPFEMPPFRRQSLKDRVLARAVELHQAGIEGSKEAVRAAYSLLERLREYYPQDTLISAYYGSALTLLGRDALDPLERLDYVRQGLKYLDTAAMDDSDNITIRILRGYICFNLPEFFFHRTATSVTDFSYVISRAAKEPGLVSDQFVAQLQKDLASARQTLAHVEKSKVTINNSVPGNSTRSQKEGESPL